MVINEPISEAAHQDWLMHPVTRALHRALAKWEQGILEQWGAKTFQDDRNPQATTVFNAAALAELDVIRRLKDLSFEQLNSILETDDEPS